MTGAPVRHVDATTGSSLVVSARAEGALVVEIDLATAAGVAALADVVRELDGFEAIFESRPWAQSALDDLLGRSTTHRDLIEIYAAVRIASGVVAQRQRVVIVFDNFERADAALVNFVDHMKMLGPQDVELVCVGRGDKGSTPIDGTFAELDQRARIALDRSDMPAALEAFDRAAALAPDDVHRRSCLLASCDALLDLGLVDELVRRVRSGSADARAEGDRCGEARFRVWKLMFDDASIPVDPTDELIELDEIFRSCGDDTGRAQVLEALGGIAWITERADAAMDYLREGLRCAQTSGPRGAIGRLANSYWWLLLHGPISVSDALAALEETEPVASTSALVEVSRLATRAVLLTWKGERDEGRVLLERASAISRDIGQPPWVARLPRIGAWIELTNDDPERALERARPDLGAFRAGAHPTGIDTAFLAARASCALGRFADALDLSDRCRSALEDPDTSDASEVSVGEISALIARAEAAQGNKDAAMAAIRLALDRPVASPRLVQRGEMCLDIGSAYASLGANDAARAQAEQAVELFQMKDASRLVERANSVSTGLAI